MGEVGCDEGLAGPVIAGGGPAFGETGRGRGEGEPGGWAVTDTGTSTDTPPTDTRITAPPIPVALMVPWSSTDAAAGLLDTNTGLKASAGAAVPSSNGAVTPRGWGSP